GQGSGGSDPAGGIGYRALHRRARGRAGGVIARSRGMTRHRRDDEDGLDGDAAWRSKDDGRVDLPGEETRQPWERTPWDLPGWDEVTPAQPGARDANAPPSAPLPRAPPGGGPPAPGPLPRVPEEAWPPGEPGYADTRREDTSYLRTGFPDPGYAAAGSRHRG